LGIAAVALGVLVTLFLVLKVLPESIAQTAGISDASERAQEIARVRTALLAVLAGGLAAVGAYYTHRSFGLNRDALELNRQGQITERFTRAVDQLGNAGSVHVRLGGIYALERLARESQADHGPIVEILTAYIRDRAPAQDRERYQELIEEYPESSPEPPEADVQAALTVLGRRETAFDPPSPWHLDLRGAHLPRADLREARFSNADLSGALLDQAKMAGADLDGARFDWARMYEIDLSQARCRDARFGQAEMNRARMEGSDLRGADLSRARLLKAQLRYAKLAGVKLNDANLTQADLRDTYLDGARLVSAKLDQAMIGRTDLSDSDLAGTSLERARYSTGTRWPDGFDVAGSGAVLIKGP
jgi:uncharacterized protein YjbI with pentapeptide repeats